MVSCIKKITEETTGLGKRNIKAYMRFSLFDSWFISKGSAEAVVGFGAGMVGMIKTSTKET